MTHDNKNMGKLIGINVNSPTASDIQEIVDMKMKGVRIEVEWSKIEQTEGVFNWENLDDIISMLEHKHLDIYATFYSTPLWHKPRTNSVPERKQWITFMKKVVERYGKRISVYSLWNEPNVKKFWNGTLEEYEMNILLPSAFCLLGCCLGAPELSMKQQNFHIWLDKMLKWKDVYSVLSLHVSGDSVEEIENLFSKGKFGWFSRVCRSWKPYNYWLKQIGKPVWITCIGWDTRKSGEKKQSDEYLKMLQFGIPSVDAIIVHELRDEFGVKQKWGILHEDGKEKTSAYMLLNA